MKNLLCPACQSTNTNRFGHQNGKQRFLCRTCQKTWRENPGPSTIAPERKAQILAAYHERVSLRGLSRVFGVSRNTISAWVKTEFLKSRDAPHPGPDVGQGQEA